MQINFKKGLRRIVLVFIGFIMVCALGLYFSCGCIFDRYKYANNVKIVNLANDKTISLDNYLENYWLNGREYVNCWDIECHPYKQYCIYDDWEYRRNGKLKFTINDKQINLKIIAPAPVKYLFWQLWDFIKIFLFAGLLYGFYLLLEIIFCWIIKGFKTDK